MKPFLLLIVLTILFEIVFSQFHETANANFNSNPEKDFSRTGKEDSTPRIQIRAILVSCPTKDANDPFKGSRGMNKNISSVRSEDILQFHGYDKDELLIHSEVKECKRKLVITVKLNNCGRTMTEEEFVVVDHVYDPIVRKKSRLLNPLVFKLKQEQVLQLYGLTFIHMINSEAKEEVLNKNLANFTGCDTSSSKPTCGVSYIKDKVIPFSEGFCCSCDSYVNMKRQPSNREKEVNNIGFSAGQLGVPIAGPELRSARSSGEDNVGSRNKEFLAKGLWGDLLNNGFQEVKSFRVPRSMENPTTVKVNTTENDNFDNLSENDQIVDSTEINKDDYDSNLSQFPNNAEDEFSNGFDDTERDNSEFSETGLNMKEVDKPWLLQTDNKFHTFIQRLRVKDKKPANMSELFEEPVGIQLKHFLNPPLEIAKGFLRSDFKNSMNKNLSPWEDSLPDKAVQPNIGSTKYNNCHKYMHILTKLLEQGIDLENDLNLAPEDIIEGCKEPEKGNRFIKSIIQKAERKLRDKNIDKEYDADYIQPHYYKKRRLNKLNHYRYRRNSKDKPVVMRSLTNISNNKLLRAPKEKSDPMIDNSSNPGYILDIVWDSCQNLTGGNDNVNSLNQTLRDEGQLKLKDNIATVDQNHSNEYYNNNVEIVWVKSLDYDVSDSLADGADNRLTNDSSDFENRAVYDHDKNNIEEEVDGRLKRSILGGKVDIILNNGRPVISIQSNNKSSENKKIQITTDVNSNLRCMNYGLNSLFGECKQNEGTKIIFPDEKVCRAGLRDNSSSQVSKQYKFDRKSFLNNICSNKQLNLNNDIPFENEYNVNKFPLQNYQERTNKVPIVSSNYLDKFILDPDNSKVEDEVKLKLSKNFSQSEEGINPSYPEGNKIDDLSEEQYFMVPPRIYIEDPINLDWKNETERVVNYSNDLITNQNLSDHVNSAITDLKEDNNSIGDDYQMNGSDTEFDVFIDRSSNMMNNAEVFNHFNFPENYVINSTGNEVPDKLVWKATDLISQNSTDNMKQRPIQDLNQFTDKDFSQFSDFKNAKTDKNIDVFSNFNAKNEKTESSLDILEKKLSLKSSTIASIRRVKINYIDDRTINKDKNYKLNNSIVNIDNKAKIPVTKNKLLLHQQNLNSNAVKGKCDRVKNILSFQSSMKPLHLLDSELNHLVKISNEKLLASKQFEHLKFPALKENEIYWKFNDIPHFRKTYYQPICNYDSIIANKSAVNKERKLFPRLYKLNLNHQNKENISHGVIDGKNEFSPYYLKSGKQYHNLNKSDYVNKNYNYYVFNDSSRANENHLKNLHENDNASIIVVKKQLSNESQFTSIILPANITKQKGIKGKLLFIPDKDNSLVNYDYMESNYSSSQNLKKRNVYNSSNVLETSSNNNYINLNHEFELKPVVDVNVLNYTETSQNGSTNDIHLDFMKMNITPNEKNVKSESLDVLESKNKLDRKRRKVNKKGDEVTGKSRKKVKRQILSSGVQFRGGQSCIDRSVPPYANPVTYHESAHCLRFSDLWYSVYRLKRPFIEHSVHIQLYEKHNYPDGRTHWHEITKGMAVNVGTFVRHVHDAIPTLAFTYIPFTDQNAGVFCLDPAKTTLLMPQPLPPEKASNFPQTEGGPRQYMLVKDAEISFDGEECDKAGVSFEAFCRQPDRCAQPRGTCLKNQPIDMWRQDMEAKRNNKPGKYFLENYASIPNNPFKMNQSTHEEFLALDYMGRFTSAIEVEVRSDLNAIVRTGSSGQITEVYVDATCEFHTRITVIVTNLGLASSGYFPRLASCPVEVPEVWTHNEGPIVNISPQHRHIFRMSLYGTLPVDRFYCSLELLNEKRELVATRRIRLQRHDRCLCQWHCLCACIGSIHGLACETMSVEHYHAAGFQGSLPVVNLGIGCQQSLTEKLCDILLLICFALLPNIILLGLIKVLLGLCCCSTVGSWGLWLMFSSKAKTLDAYKEPNITNYNVIKDEAGFSVHPINGTRNVRILSKCGEFCINFIFFPVAFIIVVLKSLQLCCCGGGGKAAEESDNEDYDDNESAETKRQKSLKEKKKQIMGPKLSERESSWSLPSVLEVEEDEKFIMQERETSQQNLQENKNARSRGGADIVDDAFLYCYDWMKDVSIDSGKLNRDNLSELEKEMAELLVNTLQYASTVYRNLKDPIGGVSLPQGCAYSVKGNFVKTGSTYQFKPPAPMLQHWAAEKSPIIPPIMLDITVLEVVYHSPEDVLLANELSLLPRGIVVNVWHSLDDESEKLL